MSFCKDCISGVIHEGTPSGKLETIGGIECYVATPTIDYPKDKVVLFLTDVFGIPLINNKLLADAFALNGFKTIMPDLFGGDPISDELMNNPDFDPRAVWVPNHLKDSWGPILDAVVAALQAGGVTRFATSGYCFSAHPAFYLANSNTSHVTSLAHPSLLKIPTDIEKYRDSSKAPLLLHGCQIDSMFPPELQTATDAVLGDGKFAHGYERLYWDGCKHGFAVRGDLSDPNVKAGKEGAFKATVEWFIKYL